MKYVNAYSVVRNFGGPEEGGWWYDSGEPLASLPFADGSTQEPAIEGGKAYLSALFAPEFEGNRTRYSVIGDANLEIYVEDHPAVAFPAETPHYE